MGTPLRLLAVAVLAAAAFVTERQLDPEEENPPPRLEVVDCEAGGGGAAGVRPLDVRVGPITLGAIRASIGKQADAFDSNGYKIGVVVDRGTVATLAAAASARPNVRFAYTQRSARRASREGVGGAPVAVRFEACDRRRTGYPGGIIIRTRGCYPIVVRQQGEGTIRRRIPLGRAC